MFSPRLTDSNAASSFPSTAALLCPATQRPPSPPPPHSPPLPRLCLASRRCHLHLRSAAVAPLPAPAVVNQGGGPTADRLHQSQRGRMVALAAQGGGPASVRVRQQVLLATMAAVHLLRSTAAASTSPRSFISFVSPYNFSSFFVHY